MVFIIDLKGYMFICIVCIVYEGVVDIYICRYYDDRVILLLFCFFFFFFFLFLLGIFSGCSLKGIGLGIFFALISLSLSDYVPNSSGIVVHMVPIQMIAEGVVVHLLGSYVHNYFFGIKAHLAEEIQDGVIECMAGFEDGEIRGREVRIALV